jgi:hypothetical protein
MSVKLMGKTKTMSPEIIKKGVDKACSFLYLAHELESIVSFFKKN